MPRQRDANRDKAKEIYLAHNGDIALVEIARQLGMATEDSDGSGTVRGWKSKDKWDDDLYGTLQKKRTERSEQEKPRSKRSVKNASNDAGISKSGENPVGSNAETNTKRRGAPLGNQNALNNKGGIGAKPKNKLALKTREYETIYYSDLDPEELEFLNMGKVHFADKYHQQLMLIQDLTLREMRMRRDIKELKNTPGGMIFDSVSKERGVSTLSYTVRSKEEEGAREPREETTTSENSAHIAKPIHELLLKKEEALTRVQGRKQKAIEVLHKMELDDERLVMDKEMKDLKKQILTGQIDLDSLLDGEDITSELDE